MPDPTPAPPLRPATREEIEQTLSYGLRFNLSGKAYGRGNDIAVSIAAGMLVDHLDRSGFVLMKKPPARNTD